MENKVQRAEQERLSAEYDKARSTDYGNLAADLMEATQADPTRLLAGRIVDVYNTITASGFVIERDGKRYDVRVTETR